MSSALTAMHVLAALPLGLALAVGRAAGSVAYHLLRVRRRVVHQNLRHVYGATRDERAVRRIARQCYRQFGMSTVETLRSVVAGPAEVATLTQFAQLEPMLELLRRKSGIIFCIAHSGSFDFVGLNIAAAGVPYHAIMRPLKNRRLSELLVQSRERFGCTCLLKGAAAFQEARRILARGEAIVILPDQNARTGAVTVDFLGKPASTFRSPALLHLLTGAPLVVGVAYRDRRDPRRHWMELTRIPDHTQDGARESKVKEPPSLESKCQEAAIRTIMQQVCDTMAKTIHEHPEQYFWFHRRWGKLESA